MGKELYSITLSSGQGEVSTGSGSFWKEGATRRHFRNEPVILAALGNLHIGSL